MIEWVIELKVQRMNEQAHGFERVSVATAFFLLASNFMIRSNYLNGSFIWIDGDNGKMKPT